MQNLNGVDKQAEVGGFAAQEHFPLPTKQNQKLNVFCRFSSY